MHKSVRDILPLSQTEEKQYVPGVRNAIPRTSRAMCVRIGIPCSKAFDKQTHLMTASRMGNSKRSNVKFIF